MVTVKPHLIHDAFVEPHSAPALRAVPTPVEVPDDAEAEPVWVSPGVEGYHTSAHCSSLLSDIVVRGGGEPPPIRMELSDAIERGMNICKWCRAWQQML